MPTLTIKFGDGENIQLTEGTVAGSSITYIYTVKNTDKGVMTTVDYKGGNIKDVAGNVATLSCPALVIQYSSGDFVYANGTATNPNDSENNNNNNNNNSNGGTNNGDSNSGGSNNNNSNNGGSTNSGNNGGSSNGDDKTTAPGVLPQTGESAIIALVIVSISILGIVTFIQVRKLRGI